MMMKYKKTLLVGVLAVVLLAALSACGNKPDMDGATAFGEEFLSVMAAGDYEAGMAMFHPTFKGRIGLTAEQLLIVLPPTTFNSFDYAAIDHELTDVDGSTYSVVRMDGTMVSKLGTPIRLVLDVVSDDDGGYAIDGWVFELGVNDRQAIKEKSQLVMLALWLGDFEELARASSASVSIEGAELAFPRGSIDRFEVLNIQDVVALSETSGLLPVQLVEILMTEGASVRVAMFWVFVEDTWKLQGVYACPAGGLGGMCDLVPKGVDPLD